MKSARPSTLELVANRLPIPTGVRRKAAQAFEPQPSVTFLMSDVVGFTPMIERGWARAFHGRRRVALEGLRGSYEIRRLNWARGCAARGRHPRLEPSLTFAPPSTRSEPSPRRGLPGR